MLYYLKKVLLILCILLATIISPLMVAQAQDYTFVFDGKTFSGTRITHWSGGQPFYFIIADEPVCLEITLEMSTLRGTQPHTYEFMFKKPFSPTLPVDSVIHSMLLPPYPQTAQATFQVQGAYPVYSESLGDIINGSHHIVSPYWPTEVGLSWGPVIHSLCGESDAGFNPIDNRIDGRPGDRIAVYCEPDALTVYGVGNDSKGFLLASFSKVELQDAGVEGVFKDVGANGTISASMDDQSNFWVAWTGGQFGASGQGDFAKGGVCAFSN